MSQVIVVGGGWAGCAAALSAAKAGSKVSLFERTDLLLGTGLAGGIFRNNGRFTAAEEAIAMGGGDLFVAMDANSLHRGIDFPGHNHASVYDVNTMELLVKKILQNYNIDVKTNTRVSDVLKQDNKISGVIDDKGEIWEGEAFVDATGTAGPMGNCLRYGNGCAMCIIRCPSFGPRVSLTSKVNVKEIAGKRQDGSNGAMSGSCKLKKNSLAIEIKKKLESSGVLILPLPEHLKKRNLLGKKACTQYAIDEYAENLILIDTGAVKMMTSYFPVDDLRTIPGFEEAQYEDPYSGGIGNSVRYIGISPCSTNLKIEGMDNLFCCGEKAGTIVGHTEAVITGLLAGNNAARYCAKINYLELPNVLTSGDFINYVHTEMKKEGGLCKRYTFSGDTYFERMKQLNLYSTNRELIISRVIAAGMNDIYSNSFL